MSQVYQKGEELIADCTDYFAIVIMVNYYLAGYTIIALAVGFTLLWMFIQDSTVSITDRTCWIVLIGAALFWPIVLPISVRERMAQSDCHSKQQPNFRIDRIPEKQLSELGTYPKA
ncbi:MAG: hypothetical protein WAN66_08360 [Limnoraphis robusta]